MKNKSINLIVYFIFILIATSFNALPQTSNGKQCNAYEPTTVNLTGKLKRKAVINASEQKENIWVLKLNNEICVTADANNEINLAFERIAEVQLVFSSDQLVKYRSLQNQKISVSGTLFAGHTQHHFTEVLLMITEVKKL
jgi:hypothetical protein